MSNEPVMTASALVAAVLGLLVAFGVQITDDQQRAIATFVAVVVPLAAGLVARRKVTPVAKG